MVIAKAVCVCGSESAGNIALYLRPTVSASKCLVVDGVSDTEHDFAGEVRTDRLRLALTIARVVGHHALTSKDFARKAPEFIDQPLRHETCATHRILQLRIAAPLIIVDLARTNPFCQTEKVIEHVPIVSAEGRRGLFFGWAFKQASVRFVADAIQEDATLLQDVSNCSIQRRGHHVRTFSRRQEFACGARTGRWRSSPVQRWQGRTEVPCRPA